MPVAKSFHVRKAGALFISTILASGLAVPAYAQSGGAPAPYKNADEFGVDVSTGTFNLGFNDLGNFKLAGSIPFERYWKNTDWTDNWSGFLRREYTGGQHVITIVRGDTIDRFTLSGSNWVAQKADGSKLIQTGGTTPSDKPTFEFTTPEGVKINYALVGSNVLDPTDDIPHIYQSGSCVGQWWPSLPISTNYCAIPTQVSLPSGANVELSWRDNSYDCWLEWDNSYSCVVAARLEKLTDNSGYAVDIRYSDDYGSVTPAWLRRTTVKAIDTTVDSCAGYELDCTTTHDWPTATYSTPSSGTEQTVDALGRTWKFGFTSYRITSVQKPGASSATTSISYDGSGKPTSVTKDGETKTYSWSTSGGNTNLTITDPSGSGTVVTNPSVGQPSSITNATSNTTTYTYDGNNRLTRATQPEGDYVEYSYDARGNVTQVLHKAKSGSGASDITTSASFDSTCTYTAKCNKPNYTLDAKGTRTDYTYDTSHGGVTKVQLPAATGGGTRAEVNYGYTALTASGAASSQYKLTQITTCATAATCSGTANETKVEIEYNNANLLPTKVTTKAGDNSISASTSYGYDSQDNLTTIDGPLSGTDDTTTLFYDGENRQRGVIGPDPDGGGSRPRGAERYTFDTASRITKAEIGTATAATEAALDAMTVLQTIDSVFDTYGNKTKETVSGTSGAARVVQYSYDGENRLECTALRMNPAIFGSLPSSACTMGTAGSGGNDFGADRITKNSYDANDRVTKVQTAYGASEQADEVTTSYTANGKVASVKDAEANKTAYTYDGHDRLVKTEYPSTTKGANAVNSSDYETLSYDANSNVTSRRLRDGNSIGYGYDNLNHLVSKDLPGSEPDATYSYDLKGRATGAVQNGQTLSFTHDALDRNLTQVGPRGTVTYTYDAASRRTSTAYPNGTSLTVNYDYDVTGNVTTIKENGSTTLATYAYDNAGRRSSVTYGNGVVQSFSYDANQRLSTLGSNFTGSTYDQSASLTYNPAGQIDSLSKSNDLFAWNGHYNVDRVSASNGLNQMIAATPGSGQTSVPTLSYDSKGNLTGSGGYSYTYSSENILLTGPSSASLDYDPLGRLYSVANGSGTTKFQYDGVDLIAEYDASNNLLRRYVHGPGIDEPILHYEGTGLSTKNYLTADERGTIVAVTNGSGSVTTVNTYDEYGIPGSGNATAANGGRFQYTGQTWIPELGMYYYKARFYSATLGRFMQTDPIGYGDGMNWYNYVGSDPVNFVDPSGLDTEIVVKGRRVSTSMMPGWIELRLTRFIHEAAAAKWMGLDLTLAA